ncbi:MAG: SAM-dependent DNA methyltransferase [Sphaerospermopsis sp. SIO1G2]|nr:SAM-dependent DNA methyltransferase [Sphaerospermopsis sp. SIO1G2]
MTQIDKFQQTIEFGDFQTPSWFAKQVCSLLVELGVKPDTLIEPTCGVGAFLIAGLNSFPNSSGYGIEINADYAIASQQSLASRNLEERATIINGDFFQINWDDFVDEEDQTLFIGNPPWVTNSALSKLQSKNLPQKSNFNGLKGIEAIEVVVILTSQNGCFYSY